MAESIGRPKQTGRAGRRTNKAGYFERSAALPKKQLACLQCVRAWWCSPARWTGLNWTGLDGGFWSRWFFGDLHYLLADDGLGVPFWEWSSALPVGKIALMSVKKMNP